MIRPKPTFTGFLCLFLYQFSAVAPVRAQFFSPGARAVGMGGAAATRADVWATNNNVGALGYLERAAVGLYYENRFITAETGSYGLQFAYPLQKAGTFGLAVSRFGYALFNRNAVGIRYAKSFGPHVSAGVGINYHYVSIGNGYGSASAVSAELGVLGRVNRELSVAFHLVNPVRMNLGRTVTQKLPITIRIGLSYLWAKKVLTALEVDADPEQKPNVKFGIEYKPVALFLLRGGFGSRPLGASFGFGFDYKLLRVDVSAAYHQQLGFSPQMGLSVAFGKPVKHAEPALGKRRGAAGQGGHGHKTQTP